MYNLINHLCRLVQLRKGYNCEIKSGRSILKDYCHIKNIENSFFSFLWDALRAYLNSEHILHYLETLRTFFCISDSLVSSVFTLVTFLGNIMNQNKVFM